MTPQDEELKRLQEQVAALSSRMARLERLLAPEATPPKPAAPPAPVSQPEAEAPPARIAPVAPPPVMASQLSPGPPPPSEPDTPDLESRIGSHILNRIGIIAVLLGAFYFLKLAFDNNWIGPSGRIAIGLVAGIGLILWSARFKNKGYIAFSYSLIAVGIGTMYLSLWASFQLYHLVPVAVAFVAMIVVTSSAVVIALREDSQFLALVAIVGGFATPLLLSTGENHEITLFLYIALLDIFTVALQAAKPWSKLLAVGFVATLILYLGWYLEFHTDADLGITLFFASLFFFIFAVVPLLQKIRSIWIEHGSHAVPRTVLLLALANPVVYFLQLYGMLEENHYAALAWCAVALAAFYIVISRQLRALGEDSETQTRLMPWLMLAIGLGFLTVAVPLKLEAHWITIGWFIESAVLLWIADRARSEFLKAVAVAALVLGVFRLLVVDNFHPTQLLLNSRFATYLVAVAVLGAIIWKTGDDPRVPRGAVIVASISFNVLLLIALTWEVADFFARQMAPYGPAYSNYQAWHDISITRDFSYSALWMLYGAVLIALGFWKRSALLRWQALALIGFTIGKVFLYDVSQLSRGYRVLSFIALGILLLAISFMYQRGWLRVREASE